MTKKFLTNVISRAAKLFAPHRFTPRVESNPAALSVLFTWDVYNYLRTLVSVSRGPISWFATTEKVDDHTFLVTRIFLPDQEVGPDGITIQTEDWVKLNQDILAQYPGDAGRQIINQLNFWGHTTTNTAAVELKVRQLLAAAGQPWCVFATFSKRGKIELMAHYLAGFAVSIFDLPWGIAEEINETLVAAITADIAAKVRKRRQRPGLFARPKKKHRR